MHKYILLLPLVPIEQSHAALLRFLRKERDEVHLRPGSVRMFQRSEPREIVREEIKMLLNRDTEFVLLEVTRTSVKDGGMPERLPCLLPEFVVPANSDSDFSRLERFVRGL